MIQIRKAKAEDIHFINNIISVNYRNINIKISDEENFLICEVGGEKCGCGFLEMNNKECYINWLAIKKEYRRQKLGSAIVKALLNIADLKGIEEAYMLSPCEDFSKSLGFEKEYRTLPQYYSTIFGQAAINFLYKVSLAGYFGTCMQKG